MASWTPGSAPRALPYAASVDSEGFDASAQLVAYGTGCTSAETAQNASYGPNAGYDVCRTLRAFNVTTAELLSFTTPPGIAGWVPNGIGLVSAIGPGGRQIAAYAAVRPQGPDRTRLYVLQLTGSHRRTSAVPSSAAFLFARTGLVGHGLVALLPGPGGRLWAYQPQTGLVRPSKTPCCQYTVMATVRSSPN
jgi:hypothetical protein